MDCAEIRQELGEHALGVLAADRRRTVDDHVAWCAGCRKEAGQLAEGAAVAGLAVASATPPPDLEDRVVATVRRAAGRRHRGTRTALAVAAAAALLSATLAVAMAGRVERLEDAAATAREEADRAAREFQEVLEDVGGQTPIRAAPLDGPGDAGGRALLFDTMQERDFVVLIVGGLPPPGAPYLAYLVSPGERRLSVGRLQASGPGQLERHRFFRDLAGYRDLVVIDRNGQTVLTGSFTISS